MKSNGIRSTFVRGLTLAIPLAIVFYVCFKVIQILQQLITPLATKLGIHRFLGNATLAVLDILVILVIIFILGLLTRFEWIAKGRQQLENLILKFVPSLNYLKLMAADKLDVKQSQNQWKPVVLFAEGKYNAAFVVEESEMHVTLFVSKGTSLQEGEILILDKKEVKLFPATFDQLNKFSRAFGKGFISIIEKKP